MKNKNIDLTIKLISDLVELVKLADSIDFDGKFNCANMPSTRENSFGIRGGIPYYTYEDKPWS